MKKTLLTILLASAAYAGAAPFDTFNAAVGETTRPHGENTPNTLRLSVGWDWNVRWLETSVGYVTGYWEFAGGAWRVQDTTAYDVDIVPMFRYQFKSESWCSPFVEAGVGVAYLTEHKIADDHDLTSHPQFSDRIGGGCRFDGGKQELGINFHHFSNAGLDKPNPGVDFLLVRYGYHFD
ncbi:lipid A 3-O-deacylase [Silvimonas terrae]|uniref:Lipid A deacylase n=1 Tax=Silvimonas terrae TaxID=300266 RepID=A0A840RGP1_9NEIS|nr:acyloxyacyl hydrolase [Silvimonas terrae]MBB5191496.1 lipid A 3-O-deacylase [Silvimonas terrae]